VLKDLPGRRHRDSRDGGNGGDSDRCEVPPNSNPPTNPPTRPTTTPPPPIGCGCGVQGHQTHLYSLLYPTRSIIEAAVQRGHAHPNNARDLVRGRRGLSDNDGFWHMRRVIGASKHLIVGWVGKDRGVRRMVCVALADSRT